MIWEITSENSLGVHLARKLNMSQLLEGLT